MSEIIVIEPTLPITNSGTVCLLAAAPNVSVNRAILVGKTAASPSPKIAALKKIVCHPVERINRIVPSKVIIKDAQIIWLLDKKRAKKDVIARPTAKKKKKIGVAENHHISLGKFERKV